MMFTFFVQVSRWTTRTASLDDFQADKEGLASPLIDIWLCSSESTAADVGMGYVGNSLTDFFSKIWSSLNLSHCYKITNNDLKELTSMISLINLKSCSCVLIVVKKVGYLDSLKLLCTLGLSGSARVADAGMRSLVKYTSRTDLNLGDCFCITDKGRSYLVKSASFNVYTFLLLHKV